jgi:hypothetical protein
MAPAESTYDHARALIYYVCCLAGSASFVDEIGNSHDEGSLRQLIEQRNTPKLFQWLVSEFNFQGIADSIASSYIERHGLPSWAEIEIGLEDAAC